MAAFLGIDLGLSGARAAVLSSKGELLGKGRRAYRTSQDRQEHDPRAWTEAASGAVRDALVDSGEAPIEAVGIGAFGPCAVTIDEALRPTGPASLFAFDTRHEPWRRRLLEQGFCPDAVGPDHVVPKLMRLAKTDPQRFSRTAWALDCTGYMVATLTGIPVIDPITCLDHLVEGLESPLSIPPVRSADAIAGGVSREAARCFGIKDGTPVTVGSYDSHVDLFGAGLRDHGQAGMLLGSTLVIGAVTDANASPDSLRWTPHIGPGRMLAGWTSAAGSLISWAEKVMRVESGPVKVGLPGETGLMILPYFAGERSPIWDSHARGAIIGLTLDTGRRDIRLASVEAVALSAMDITRRLEDAIGPINVYRVAGGGADIPGLAEAVASATGATLHVLAHPGEACAGAILAAHAVGQSISRPIGRAVEPDPRTTDRYLELLDIYRSLYAGLAEAMHRLGRFASKGGVQ